MFPGVDGFHWNFGHVLFLAIFFSVACVLLATLALAARRVWADVRDRRVDKIRWESDFHDLPTADRRCRHELAGEVAQRSCPNGFDCRRCSEHPRFAPPMLVEDDVFGLSYPPGRLYHRGHTWVREESDGTLTVGLDDLGARVAGKPDRLELPQPGDRLEVNGAGWRMYRGGVEVRILSPVDGEVVATGGPHDDWLLRVKPAIVPANLNHLLRGSEVRPWIAAELDRLQAMFGVPSVGPTLADGGVLVPDLPAETPAAPWDAIASRIFLDT
jgi:glycine cleavage system H protein